MPSRRRVDNWGSVAPVARRRQGVRRSLGLSVLGILLALSIAGVLVRPVPAHAQFGGVFVDPAAYTQRLLASTIEAARYLADKAEKAVSKVSKTVGDVAFKNALKVFLGKVAEDTATWVASAGTGQKPLFLTDPHYFRDLGDAAAGDYLDSLSKEKFGVSLCDPGAFKVTLDIALRVNLNPNFCKEACQKNYADGLEDANVDVNLAVAPNPPQVQSYTLARAREAVAYLQRDLQVAVDPWKCKEFKLTNAQCLQAFSEGIARAEEKLSAELKQCNSMCAAQKRRLASCSLSQIQDNAEQGLLASGLTINGQATNITGATLQQAYEDDTLPQIFRPDQNPLGMFLTANVETQAEAEAKKQEEKDILSFSSIFPLRSLISGKTKTPGSVTTDTTNKNLNPDDAVTEQTGSPVADAIGIFTNTLTSKLIERIFKGGLVDDKGNPKSFISPGTISQSSDGVLAARNRFASLAQVSFGSGGGVDILNELSSCPVDVSAVTETSLGVVEPNNCALDPSFRQAIEERLTVQEALKRGLLSDQRVFGFDANGREPAFGNGYPYRSLVILRKYRIIPVGWELAAQHIRDYEKQNVNLSSIVGKFDDPTSPYYRLVDPSWVLKAPENICRRTGFSNVVISNEYVDTDGDESGKKNIDYTKRYCNSDSDTNVGQECVCGSSDGTVAAVEGLPCISNYAKGATTREQMNLRCNEAELSNSTKPTCAYITPREQQVQRIETCVDEQTCILENDDGTCKQYGTCVQEKDAWRFNGQSCNQLYASCATFTEPAGTQVSYLQNTLQKSVCGPDNAGCQQYCSQYNYATNEWACTESPLVTRRFDRDLQSCDQSAEGCTQFIRQTTGTNLVRNASFELGSAINAAGNTSFDGWGIGSNSQSCGAEAFTSTEAAVGSQAIRLQKLTDCAVGDPRDYAYQQVDVGTPIVGRTFTFSFYAKADSAACTPSAHLRAVTPAVDNDENAGPSPFVVTTEWQRFVATHTWTTAVSPTETKIAIFLRTSPNCTMYYDGIQLEEGDLTDYKDYGAVNQVHLKRPPSGYCANNLNRTCEVDTDCYNPLTEPAVTCQKLQCTGNTATDPAACSKFIAKCSADDVGCDLFTPVAGGMNIPAKPGQTCPADKVGCASFREQPTIGALDAHDTRTGKYCASLMDAEMRSCTDDSDCGGVVGDCTPLVSFIGTSGTQCTAQDVGCEAFTNLDEVAKGGEGKAQFTKLQLCVPPAPLYTGSLSNYYTWVGNEESGYQLKKYRLVPSNLDGGVAPCTNLAHDSLACIDGTPNHPVASCAAADLGVDLDCAQYYDESGNITYRLRSRVIEQTEDCHPFRNEVDTNTYYADSTRSLSCSSAAVGCREYVGNTGSNTRTILSSDFENGTYSPWATGSPNPISTESVTFGGHSLRVPLNAQADVSGSLRQGATYLVSFWAKAEGASTPVSFGLQATAGTATLGTTAPVTTDWNAYSLGPTTIPFSTDGSNLLTASGVAAFFLDNVVLTEITDSTYKVKLSQTVCGGYEGCAAYQNRAGQVVNLMSFAKLCQTEKVGCEALINTRNSTTPFALTVTLANLRGDVDGSGKIDQADVDALNAYLGSGGAPPFPLVAGDINGSGGNPDFTDLSILTSYVRGTGGTISNAAYPGDTVTAPADRVEYWVNDPTKACNADDKGCRALGRQQVNLNPTTYAPTLLNTETVYAEDNPDTYATTLCGREALSCDEFGTSDGGKTYFRNPTGRTCEYREATGAIGSGWFVTGTSSPAPNCPIRNQGNIPPPVPNGGFAGLCPADQNGCGAFLDPVGTGESFTTNSGFEIADGTTPQNWTPGTSLQEYADHDGSKAVRLTLEDTGLFTQTVDMQPNRYYVVSVDVERNADATETNPVHFGLTGCRDAFGAQVRLYSPDGSMTSDNSGAYQEIAAKNFTDTAYQRISGRVYSGVAVTCRAFAGTVGSGLGHWFDNLQVRATTSSTVLRQTVDSTSCNGQVGDKLGCHLFNDVSNTALTYDADQSPLGSTPTDADAVGGAATCADQPELCDSNTVLKVVRDRTCSQWLAPTTTVESTKANGQKENLVVGLATCDTFSPGGQCSRFVDEKRCSNNPKQTCVSDSNCGTGVCKPFPLNGNTQAYSREELRNRSGLVVAGMQFGKACSQDRSILCTTDAECGTGNTCLPDQTIKGMFPFGVAPQLGGETATIDASVFNGNFDKTADVRNSGWIMEPVTAQSPGAPKLSVVTQEVRGTGTNVAPTSVDPYLLLEPGPDQVGWPTIRTKAGSLANRLNQGKTYYISFKARFMTTPETATRTIVGILSAEDFDGTARTWSAQHYWSHAVQITDQWQTYVVGPFKLDPGATSAEGNHYTGTHDEFFPSKGSIFFSYTSADAATNPKFAIDSVSLLSVLQVRDAVTQSFSYQPVSGDVYIARSCRAYPSATAKTCSYTDDTGKQFNGWQGFCLESDPQNPNTCLSWYPVDLLTGDRNIFGKMEIAGYSDKVPLYMCVRATGNYNRPVDLSYQAVGRTAVTTFDSSIVMSTTDGPEEVVSPLLGKEFNYRRPAVTRMKGHFERNATLQNIIAGKPGELCEVGVWPGLCSSGYEACGTSLDLTASGSSDYWVPDPQDRYRKDEIEKIVLIHQSGEPKEWDVRSWLPKNGTKSCYSNDCDGQGPTYFGPTPDGQAYMVLDHNADGKCWDPNCWAATWVGPFEGGTGKFQYNILTFRVDFDPVTQRVSRFGFSGVDATCGGGFAATVLFYLREQCTEVVQVAEANGQNAAWSGHTTSTSYALPNYRYKLSQEDKPFGSIVPPADAFDNPLDWGALLRRPLDVKQNSVDSRAGSAYACAGPGTCRGRLCILPMETSVMTRAGVSYSCDTVADEQKCVSNGGYCNGFGRAKVCVAGPKANTADPVACTYDAECGTAGRCDYIDTPTPPTFPNFSGGWYAGGKTDTQAIAHLKLLFANVYGGWVWNTENTAYEENNALITNWKNAYQDMVQCGDAGRPVIGTTASEATLASAYCGVPPEVLNVAIGKTSSNTVFINSGEVIQLRFNTTVDKEQQPLRAIAVDWDGNNQSDQIVNWGYAPLTNIAEPHSISHAYRFGDGMNVCYERGTGPYSNNTSVGDHAYCVVRPGVQVQDNWNWCNGGRCSVTFPVPDDQNYWQKFGGEIVVISP